MSLRDDYGLPKRTSAVSRLWVFMGVFWLAALILWLVSPGSAISVAVLAIALLAAVFGGVAWALSSRDLQRAPGRNPETPPSARGS